MNSFRIARKDRTDFRRAITHGYHVVEPTGSEGIKRFGQEMARVDVEAFLQNGFRHWMHFRLRITARTAHIDLVV